ncbi:uncharacterized protein VTP21DRAFT_1596 [Calcarisporiella thermophila]|uniref:uncharacterized protein n=1 Tax=Calcarisporiella thermophila TaxID=911321 RepID=UPI00374265CF
MYNLKRYYYRNPLVLLGLLFSSDVHVTLAQDLHRRQNSCSGGSDNLYCSPQPNSLWRINSTQKIIWNNLNPTIAPATEVIIWLFFKENNVFVPTYQWQAQNTGTKEVVVIPDVISKQKLPGPVDKNLTYVLQILRVDDEQSNNPKPRSPEFFILQPASAPKIAIYTSSIPSVSEIASAPSPTSPPGTLSTPTSTSTSLPPWAIGVISAACVAFIALMALGLFMWSRRRRWQSLDNIAQHPNNSEMPIIITPPFARGEKGDNHSDLSYPNSTLTSATTGELRQPHSDNPTADAETRVRGSSPLAFTTPMAIAGNDPVAQEEARRKHGEELLLKELQDEGTQIQGVSLRQTVLKRVETGLSGQMSVEEQERETLGDKNQD